KDLRPDTQYFIRIRANDNMGPGKLTNPIVVVTQKPAQRPAIQLAEGDELRVPPRTPFTITCNVTRGDPVPNLAWESKGRRISTPQKSKSISLQHIGIYEDTSFQCVAENEAGTATKEIKVIVTGPTQPEKVQHTVDGNTIHVNWKPPRITNGDIVDYEVAYTDNPTLPIDQWPTVKTGGPEEIVLPNLKEKTNYTIAIRGISDRGPGLFSPNLTALTWLA
uniref:Titin n=1 Tax=Acrobeloides nanus TaxID=290746 RepID=A0A914DBX7_9BILA